MASDLRSAALAALEALEGVAQWVEKRPDTHPWDAWQRVEPTIAALKQALAEPEQEPDGISWLKRDSGYFTAPTPRKPLTYDELEPLCEAFDSYDTTQNELVEFARAIERAHGIGEQT